MLRRKRKKKPEREDDGDLEDSLAALDISDEGICPSCGISSTEVDDLWMLCDAFNRQYDFKCTKIKSKNRIPDTYYCTECL